MIKEILKIIEVGHVELVSIDIFDTLLFRHAKTPSDIFEKVFENNRSLFPDYFETEDWANLRREAERKARKKQKEIEGNFEVTLDEIYEYIPSCVVFSDEIKKKEIEEEKENCYINPEIFDVVETLKEMGLKLILVSDMYLSREVINMILQKCQVNSGIFDDIFISNEYHESKRFHSLYYRVIEKYHIEPYQILHIGDNAESDLASARKVGIVAYKYSVISEARFRFPCFFLEEYTPFFCNKDTFSLRLLTASGNPDFWYQQGATVFGPFYVYFAQWILHEAKKNDISEIRPVMREGDFLTTLISAAARENKMDIDVTPIYASRMAIYTAGFNHITTKEIDYLFSTYNITLSNIFHLLKIESELSRYCGYEEYYTEKLRMVERANGTLYDEIIEWVKTDETIELIRNRNKNSAKNALEYFLSMGLGSKVMTVDVGWKGSIQNAIDKVLKDNGIESKLIHCVAVAKSEVAGNMFPNTCIRGFVGNCGSYSKVTQVSCARINELVLLSTKGTTVGYEKREGKVVPIIKKIDYPNWQVLAMKNLQKGILDFQRNYYKFASEEMKDCSKAKGKALEVYGLIDRLSRYPSKEEAEKYMHLQYDQNFGGSRFEELIPETDFKKMKEVGIVKFNSSYYENKIIWKSGLNVLNDDFFYMKELSLLKNSFKSYAMQLIVQEAVSFARKRNSQIILLGAGRNLPYYLSSLRLVGGLELVEAIWDNGEDKLGAGYCGKSVESPTKNIDSRIVLCTVENIAVERSLYRQMVDILGTNIAFFGLGFSDEIKEGTVRL